MHFVIKKTFCREFFEKHYKYCIIHNCEYQQQKKRHKNNDFLNEINSFEFNKIFKFFFK